MPLTFSLRVRWLALWLLWSFLFQQAFAEAPPDASWIANADLENVRTLTIEEAVAEAVQRNLSLLAQRANLSVADANVLTAGGPLRPQRR